MKPGTSHKAPGTEYIIMIVCFGNICRSPMGEALLRKYLNDDRFEVTSAGIGALDGNQATRHAVLAMKRLGLDIISHRAKYLTQPIVDESDLILAMEQSQEDYILSFYPQAKNKTFLLARFASGLSDDVADPMGQGADFYYETAILLEKHMKAAARRIKEGFFKPSS